MFWKASFFRELGCFFSTPYKLVRSYEGNNIGVLPRLLLHVVLCLYVGPAHALDLETKGAGRPQIPKVISKDVERLET